MTESLLDEIATKVGSNFLILQNILFNLDDESLKMCSLVNYRWYNVTKLVIWANRRIHQCIVPIFIERLRSFHEMGTPLHIESRTFNESHANFMLGTGVKGPRAFEEKFLSLLRRLITQPYCVILMDDNSKIDGQFCWNPNDVVNNLRPKLPQECNVIGINAHYGVIGEETQLDESLPKDQITMSSIHCRMFVMCGIVFPKYDEVSIKTYRPETEMDFQIDDDIRALIILTSNVKYTKYKSPSWQANTIFDHYQGRLALGGGQIFSKEDLEWSDDEISDNHYAFVNGPPPYKDDLNLVRASPIVIQFSGRNCQAASIHINRQEPRQSIPDELKRLEELLRKFRSGLTFRCDSDKRYQSIGFLFFDYETYRNYTQYSGMINKGIDLFYQIFPKTLVTGALCHSTYRHNFVPNTEHNISNQEGKILSDQGIASFVLIVMKKNEF